VNVFGRFADDAVYAYGDDVVNETAPRTIVTGPEIEAAVAELDGAEILSSVKEGRDRLLEARLADTTIGAALQLDASGAIVRAVSYRSQLVEPSRTWANPPAQQGDVRQLLEAYFSLLEGGDAAGAAACFSEDVLYSHPPYAPGRPRVEYRGRDALQAGFEKRGLRPWRHRILVAVQDGSECIVEGDVGGLDDGRRGGFLSSLSLDADGRILRYCSFYTEPAVPRV
jgi:SnoaL-like protein